MATYTISEGNAEDSVDIGNLIGDFMAITRLTNQNVKTSTAILPHCPMVQCGLPPPKNAALCFETVRAK